MIASAVPIKHLPEYDSHDSVVRIENEDLGVVGFIAIHRKRGDAPSLGATRIWKYFSEDEALHDALRLSRLMSYKSAFAELPYGGAKATLTIRGDVAPDREKLFKWYAGVINDLEGAFVTGSDVGVSPEDVGVMRQHSNFIIGHGVPAEYYTALGVLGSIRLAMESIYGSADMRRRSFAIQGLGKTGLELLKILYPQVGKILVSDIDNEKMSRIQNEFPNVEAIPPAEIHRQEVDVFAPCALQHSISAVTLPHLACRAVVGSANNQLESSDLAEQLQTKKILYVPDYIANNGGMISVADQYLHGTHDESRIERHIERAHDKLRGIFELSHETGLSPLSIANRQVEAIISQ